MLGLRVNISPNPFTWAQGVELDQEKIEQVRRIRQANSQEQDEAINPSE